MLSKFVFILKFDPANIFRILYSVYYIYYIIFKYYLSYIILMHIIFGILYLYIIFRILYLLYYVYYIKTALCYHDSSLSIVSNYS